VVAPYEKLYSVNFPLGVVGIEWGSDSSMSTVHVRGWSSAAAGQELMTAGIRVDDLLVSVDGELVAGMPFGQVLERIWATAGKQPGKGQFYRVVTEGPYGIGVRTKPFKDAARTGQDLLRGTIFEVDEVVEREDDPWTWLHLADNSGWVFDTKDPAIPAVQNIKDKDPGGTLALWRGTRRELQDYMGMYLQRGQETDTHTMTIIDGEDQVFQLQVKNGANLRDSLIDNGFQVYENARQVFNCDAKQLCGTCVVHVMDGESNATVQSVNEMRAMASNPRGFRLSCNTDVYGDLTVRLRPGAILGGGTS
jgi:ferredoxin